MQRERYEKRKTAANQRFPLQKLSRFKKKKKMGGCDGSCEELPYAKNCLKLFHQDSVGGRLSVFSLYSPLSTPDVF